MPSRGSWATRGRHRWRCNRKHQTPEGQSVSLDLLLHGNKNEAVKLKVGSPFLSAGQTVARSCAAHVLDRWYRALSVNPRCAFSARSLEQNLKSGQQRVSPRKTFTGQRTPGFRSGKSNSHPKLALKSSLFYSAALPFIFSRTSLFNSS